MIAVRLLRSPLDGSVKARVDDLLEQFTGLKEDFDRSVHVQLLATVLTSGESPYSKYPSTLTCAPS